MILTKHCNPGAEADGLALAEDCTAKELPARLKGGPKRANAHSILLRLTPRQYAPFEDILLANGASRPTKGRGLVGKERALMRALRVASASGR